MKKLLLIFMTIFVVMAFAGCDNETSTSKGSSNETSLNQESATTYNDLNSDGTYVVGDNETSKNSSVEPDLESSFKNSDDVENSSSSTPENKKESTSSSKLTDSTETLRTYEAEIDFSELE